MLLMICISAICEHKITPTVAGPRTSPLKAVQCLPLAAAASCSSKGITPACISRPVADQLKQQKEHELAEAQSLIQALQQEQQKATKQRSQEQVSMCAI